jgi:hypothetical protein
VGGRNHCGNDDTISCEVAEGLKPTCMIVRRAQAIPLEKRRVKCVCVINRFLQIFQGNRESEGEAPQILEEAIKAIGPKAIDYVIFVGHIPSKAGTPDAREISSRLSIISERLKKRVEMVQVG